LEVSYLLHLVRTARLAFPEVAAARTALYVYECVCARVCVRVSECVRARVRVCDGGGMVKER